eukprot:366486-Chlamydomonas_euryale.AAC.11
MRVRTSGASMHALMVASHKDVHIDCHMSELNAGWSEEPETSQKNWYRPPIPSTPKHMRACTPEPLASMTKVFEFMMSDLEAIIKDRSIILSLGDIKAYIQMILQGLQVRAVCPAGLSCIPDQVALVRAQQWPAGVRQWPAGAQQWPADAGDNGLQVGQMACVGHHTSQAAGFWSACSHVALTTSKGVVAAPSASACGCHTHVMEVWKWRSSPLFHSWPVTSGVNPIKHA